MPQIVDRFGVPITVGDTVTVLQPRGNDALLFYFTAARQQMVGREFRVLKVMRCGPVDATYGAVELYGQGSFIDTCCIQVRTPFSLSKLVSQYTREGGS